MATVHEATGHGAVVTFHGGNLEPVARAIRQQYPNAKIVLVADNDQWTQNNPGVTKATAAAKAIHANLVIPQFAKLDAKPTDFNDLANSEGIDMVRQQLTEALPIEGAGKLTHLDGVTLKAFGDIEPEAVAWAWEGRIPARALTLIVGDPDTGKTTISLALAALWSTGTLPGDWEDSPVHIVIASCEDSPSTTIRPRLEMAGADLSRVHFLTMRRDAIEGGITIPEDLAQVEAAMLACGARILIIDPIMGHLGTANSFKDQDIRKALGPLAALADRVDAVVLGIMHLNKKDCASITNRVGGSVGFVAAARSVLLAGQDPDQEEHGYGVLVHAKCNLAARAPTRRYQLEGITYHHEGTEIKTSRVVWGKEAEHIHVGDVLQAPGKSGDEPGQKSEAKDWLKAFLGEGEKPAADILKEGSKIGVSEKTIRRAKKELGIVSSKGEFSGVWSWALPGGDKEADEGGQTSPEGGHQREVDRLRLNPCKKSNNSNNLPEGGQGSTDDHLRSDRDHLRERSDTEESQVGLFDQKEAVLSQKPDGGFEEVVDAT